MVRAVASEVVAVTAAVEEATELSIALSLDQSLQQKLESLSVVVLLVGVSVVSRSGCFWAGEGPTTC